MVKEFEIISKNLCGEETVHKCSLIPGKSGDDVLCINKRVWTEKYEAASLPEYTVIATDKDKVLLETNCAFKVSTLKEIYNYLHKIYS